MKIRKNKNMDEITIQRLMKKKLESIFCQAETLKSSPRIWGRELVCDKFLYESSKSIRLKGNSSKADVKIR